MSGLKPKNNGYIAIGKYETSKEATANNQLAQQAVLDSALTELQKLTGNNTPDHDNLITAVPTVYTGFASLTFTVYAGEADVLVNGKTVRFPLIGTGPNSVKLNGSTVTVSDASASVTITPLAGGKVYVTIVN